MSLQVTTKATTDSAVDQLDNASELLLTATCALQMDAGLITSDIANAIASTINAAMSIIYAVRRTIDEADRRQA